MGLFFNQNPVDKFKLFINDASHTPLDTVLRMCEIYLKHSLFRHHNHAFDWLQTQAIEIKNISGDKNPAKITAELKSMVLALDNCITEKTESSKEHPSLAKELLCLIKQTNDFSQNNITPCFSIEEYQKLIDQVVTFQERRQIESVEARAFSRR